MNWDNYLLESKSPVGSYAHLGILDGTVQAPFDLSELAADTRFLSISTPLKKFKRNYSNLSHLRGSTSIEAITLNDMDAERVDIFATLPNLKYLHISNNQQDEIPDLSALLTLEVLILANIKKVDNIDFIKGLKTLKTLYIYGINQLYDLAPIASLPHLKELFIDHGKMSGTGKSVKNIQPLEVLNELQYLHLIVTIEDKKPDMSPIYPLKNLQELHILPRYLKNGEQEVLKHKLPLITDW